MRQIDPLSSSPKSSARSVPSVLVLAYAFPPIQVPMTPVVARLTAGLNQLGFAVDLICAHPGASPVYLPQDASLLDYVSARCRRVQRLRPDAGLLRFFSNHRKLTQYFPDCMAGLHESAFRAVMAAAPSSYSAVLSVSPFHTVNPVMVRVKRAHPQVRWIAHFCDPWAENPLEPRPLVRRWNAWREPQTLRAATYVTHSSSQALEMVLAAHPFLRRERTRVVPHEFDRALYPARPKRRNDQVTLRFIGTLFGRRSPTPLFRALSQLLKRRPDLRDALRLELIGPTDRELSAWDAFSDLPAGLVCHRPNVEYVASLELMYDADLLLVIEADVAATPFVPSKIMDYMGANTPIIGIVPAGGCREILDRLGCLTANPNDTMGIAGALETGIARVVRGGAEPWCRDEVRRSFDLTSGTAAFVPLIMDTAPQ